VVIFTDGSKKTSGTGAGFWEPRSGTAGIRQLPKRCEVLAAEMLAIEQACRWAAVEVEPGRDVTVMTDSFSSWLMIFHGGGHTGEHRELRDGVFEAAERIDQGGGKLRVGWIPSHCGVAGNEKADELAGLGATGNGELIHVVPSKKELRRAVKKSVKWCWQRDWEGASTGRYRFEVQAELRPRVKTVLRRKDDVLWNRLRLGVARLGRWRQLVLHEGDGDCEACQEGRETLRHVLIECRAYDDERERLWRELRLNGRDRTLQNMLTETEPKDRTREQRVTAIRDFLTRIRLREWVIMV